MIIAIDAREMVGAIAGKGRYILEVVKNLSVIDRENTYYLYSKQPLGITLSENFHNVLIGGLPGLRQLWLALDARKRGCEFLFSPTGYLPVVFSLIPSVVTVHDLAVFVSKDAKPTLKTYFAEKLLLGMATRRARHIIAVSKSTKNDLVKLFRVPEKKITVTLLGYDKDVYTQVESNDDDQILKSYSLTADSYLLFLGTLEPRKNIVGIIRAYSQLPKELRAKYRLVIGGKKGWYYEEIFTTVRALKLENEIQFLGRLPDEHLPALYRNAKLFLFPSFYEGFGLPPLEAMACGTPVISANISSLPEVIGDAGLLVDPYNIDELAQAIERLLTDNEVYTRLKGKIVTQAEKFSWQETAKQTLAVFQKSLRGTDPSHRSGQAPQ